MPKASDVLFHASQKKFLLSAFELNARSDGRQLLDFRDIKINFHPKMRGNVIFELSYVFVVF
jgi:exosome complex RNA-binding protein Rrp42 (RNase PH superfamily)